MKNQNENTGAPGGYVYPTIIDGEKVGNLMQRSADNQVQQETRASEIASETSQEAAYTRVDHYTLEVIQQIFPAPNKGLEFTAGILHYAKIKQNVLPGLEDMGERVAVISIRTIRTLAQLINWGYDTTHKYVTTFCALGLLRKIKHGAERLLVFPLERYVLPINLQQLDSLIAKSRPKVQQFARQVKIRLLQLNPAIQSSDTELGTFDGHKVSSRNTIYQSLYGLMESEGIDSATSRHLSKRIINEVLSQFDASMLTIQTHDKTYEQAATGTLDGGRYTGSTFTPPHQSSHSQLRSTRYHSEPSQYQAESTSHQAQYPGYQAKSTNRQSQYPRYQVESSQYQIESTSHQAQYPRNQMRSSQYQVESTNYQAQYPPHQEKSTPGSSQSRLSGTKVSAHGRLMKREVPRSPLVEETLADRRATSRVSQRPSKEYDPIGQEEAREPEAYTVQEMFSHIMTTWDMLTSYECILRENLIDWEADGLPTGFIEEVYEGIYTVNTDFAEKGMAVASHSFFLSVLEKRVINKLADDYKLDFISVYNLILFRTNRERFMIAGQPVEMQPHTHIEETQTTGHDRHPQYKKQYHTDDSYDDNAPEYNEHQSTKTPYANEYQAPVDSYTNEYQPPVDLEQDESTRQKPLVDSHSRESRDPVDSSSQGSTHLAQPQASEEELDTQEPTPPQLSLNEIIDQAAVKDGLARLRIPRALNKQNYTPEFLNVYVTYNINKLFKKLLDDVTLRNDGKMFFAEIFDTARAGAAKNWYNKLFTRGNSPETLLAGFIETIIDLHSRGNATIQNPGALFNKKITQCEKAISESTRKHIEVYGELCYEDFVLEIARLASRESLGIRQV